MLSGTTPTTFDRAVDLVLVGGAGLGLWYGGYWHATRSLVEEHLDRLLGWLVGGTALFVLIGVVSLYMGSSTVETSELANSIHATASVGLAAGLLVGTVQASAIASAEAAARATAQAEAIRAEQRRLSELNDLLRHYVLNGVNVIDGYASELRPVVPTADQAALDAIERRAATIANLVQHVGSLAERPEQVPTASGIDLRSAVEAALGRVDGAASITFVDESADDVDPVVDGGETLADAIALLLEVAAECTEDGGGVTVTLREGASTATLSVVASPATLSVEAERAPFEPVGGGVGLSLFLARRLVDGYGDLRRRNDDSEAVAFELTLGRRSDDGG